MGRLISCKDASRLISQIQEGSVPLGQRLRVRLHLIWCEACKQFERQIRFLRVMMRQYRQ
jgi:Putative zinc-finger